MNSIELFAGAGGLAIGMGKAGFRHSAVVEWDHDACETFRENQRHHSHAVDGWPLFELDVRDFDFRPLAGKVEVVSGGPPCQPFSLGGKHRGYMDSRDMFPQAVRAVRDVRPKAFIFENVKGLMRESFADYFEYIYLQLSHPGLLRKKEEPWAAHRDRLEKHHTSNKVRPEYNVVYRLLNAADYGVPQSRERVFFVGFRSDLGIAWSFPEATHSHESLLRDKWISKAYWERHEVSPRQRPKMPEVVARHLGRLASDDLFEGKQPWKTVRDALVGLPPPRIREHPLFANHKLWPGARAYKGHTGSLLDAPAKTLKAGDHGVPGGENMVVMPDGSVRYFSIREAARLQTFPDDYIFPGSWSEAMRQLGNAVPVQLGQAVASAVAHTLTFSAISAPRH